MRIGSGLLGAVLLFQVATVQASAALRVAYAGSMGVVMDRFLGPTFARQQHIEYQGIGRGAYGLAHLLVAHQVQADVFISITPGPLDIVRRAGLVAEAVPVASTQMVISYSPKSAYVKAFRQAADGHLPWYDVLSKPGLRFGRTDPVVDPQGRNIIFTLQLAARYYHRPGLLRDILGENLNPRQIFSEASLLSRLEAGQVDAASSYLSSAQSRHLPYILLPREINLGAPGLWASWYRHAQLNLRLADGQRMVLHPQPLVFYAAVLANSPHPALARQFVRFLLSPAAQKVFRENGYGGPEGEQP